MHLKKKNTCRFRDNINRDNNNFLLSFVFKSDILLKSNLNKRNFILFDKISCFINNYTCRLFLFKALEIKLIRLYSQSPLEKIKDLNFHR